MTPGEGGRVGNRCGERGASALEFGLVAPLVFAALFGVLQYGYHFWSLETAAATAREAARKVSVGTAWPCTRERAVEHASAPALDTGPPQVTHAYDSGASEPVVGALVTVTVRFRSLDIGFLPVPDGGWVEQSATARVENVPRTPLGCDDPWPPSP